MKIAVIYDSYFGNTQKIAETIATALQGGHEVVLTKAAKVDLRQIQGFDLAVFGSPTRAFRATKPVKDVMVPLIKENPGLQVAIFDTRVDVAKINNKFLKVMVKIFGYAIDDLKKAATKAGGTLAVYVLDSEGPLAEDATNQAVAWAKSLTDPKQ